MAFSVGFLISFLFAVKLNLIENNLAIQLLQLYISVIAASSIGFAMLKYTYQIEEDRKAAAIEQISFFREEIISKHEEFCNKIEIEYNLSRQKIRLDDSDIEELFEKYPDIVSEHFAFVFIQDIHDLQVHTLNLLEEFSLKVKHYKTKEHEALTSLPIPFVEIVETHAVALLHMRHVGSGMPTYGSILELYSFWKDLVDRREISERITGTWRKIYSKSDTLKIKKNKYYEKKNYIGNKVILDELKKLENILRDDIEK